MANPSGEWHYRQNALFQFHSRVYLRSFADIRLIEGRASATRRRQSGLRQAGDLRPGSGGHEGFVHHPRTTDRRDDRQSRQPFSFRSPNRALAPHARQPRKAIS